MGRRLHLRRPSLVVGVKGPGEPVLLDEREPYRVERDTFQPLASLSLTPSAVGVDELDAGLLKGPLYDLKRRASRSTRANLQLVNGNDPYPSELSEVLLVPVKEATRRPALLCGDHLQAVNQPWDSFNP
jgi:hypothetical protein